MLLSSIVYILFNREEEDYAIRSILVRFENLNSNVFGKRMTKVNELTFKQHISKMLRPGAWATHLEVMAAASYFQLPVYFCQDPPPPNRKTYCWQAFRPLGQPEAFRFPIQVDPLFEGISLPTHFEVLYHHDSQHYSSLDGNVPTVAPELSGPDGFPFVLRLHYRLVASSPGFRSLGTSPSDV